MKFGRVKHSIPYFFLVVFLSMKMAGFHAISHASDKEYAAHCLICDHVIAHNLTPALAPDVQDVPLENVTFVVPQEIGEHYDFIGDGIIAPDQLFSRPPPSFL